MTLTSAMQILAGLLLIAAFCCKTPKRLRLLAVLSMVLFAWSAVRLGSPAFLGLCAAVIGVNLFRLRRRPPTRPMADVDQQVHECIREISAESRYSSAGIEF